MNSVNIFLCNPNKEKLKGRRMLLGEWPWNKQQTAGSRQQAAGNMIVKWYVYNMWYDSDAICDMWYVICDMWYVICDMWYVICDMWYVICDMWYVICDMWYDIEYVIWYWICDMILNMWYDIEYVIWYWICDMIICHHNVTTMESCNK